jgi:hypothetical protein
MANRVNARFRVAAVSRHPRLGRDYDPVAHTYSQRYINPATYGITVDAFPGKTLLLSKGDQQVGPQEDVRKVRDIWELSVPPGTTGFEFRIRGRPVRKLPFGPPPSEFTATTTNPLRTTRGEFNDAGVSNAWNCRFNVPGPGRYEVTARTLSPGGGGAAQTKSIVLRDFLVVSIGDSAASGEGNPDIPGQPRGFDADLDWWDIVPPIGLWTLSRAAYNWLSNVVKKNVTTVTRALEFTLDMDPAPVWLEEKAHRSLRSGHAHAARLVQELETGTVVTFLPFGRTGATILEGLVVAGRGSDDAYIDNISEIAEVVRTVHGRRIDALLIYIGINDMRISGTLKDLLKGDNALVGNGDDTANREAIKTRADAALSELPAKFQQLRDAIDARLNVRHVYLCEYPGGLFDDRNAVVQQGCGVFESDFDLDLTRRDAELVQALAHELNGRIKDAANEHGWFYVTNIENKFRGRGYCTTVDEGRWFVQAEESLGTQGDTEGTVHPNAIGHLHIGKQVAAMLKLNTIGAGTEDLTHSGPGPKLPGGSTRAPVAH